MIGCYHGHHVATSCLKGGSVESGAKYLDFTIHLYDIILVWEGDMISGG